MAQSGEDWLAGENISLLRLLIALTARERPDDGGDIDERAD
jgi:hypothetical protein